MLREAFGERANRDGREAEERHDSFEVGKVHWCYPFSAFTKFDDQGPGNAKPSA
jgi:hypothetical protein